MAQLTVKDLTLGYEGKPIITGLNFEVEAGDYLCIVGENGSGKSTLMRTLLRLQPAISGTITTGDGLARNEIGYLPQQSIVQRDFPASVWEVVLSGCLPRIGLSPWYGSKAKKLAIDSMEKMEITHLKNRCYRELSGGQQQRVLLARALCATRKMLLLDEPVAGLDPLVTADMYDIIMRLNADDGITVIMITHDVKAAIKYANKVLHIGNELFFGTRDEYLKDPSSVGFSSVAGGEA